MNGTTEVDPNPSRAWASEQLGVPGELTPQLARSALFQKLDRADYCAPDSWVQAVAVLDPSGSTFPDFSKDVNREIQSAILREGQLAIDEFAGCFWENAPQARRERWHYLRGRYSDVPNLVERLQRLQPGLDVVIGHTTIVDESADRSLLKLAKTLHDNIVEWFPLAAAIRASLRRNWLAGIPRNRQWESAAEHLTQHYPDIAALDPELTAFLTENCQRIRQVHASVKAREKIVTDQIESSTSSDSSGRGLWWLIFVAIWICVKLVGSCQPSSRSSLPSSTPTHPSPFSKFTDEQRAELDALLSKKTVTIPTNKAIPDWVRFPDRFNKDGSPKVLDWVPGEVPSPGEKAWRNAGGIYRHEDPAIPPIPKGAYLP